MYKETDREIQGGSLSIFHKTESLGAVHSDQARKRIGSKNRKTEKQKIRKTGSHLAVRVRPNQ